MTDRPTILVPVRVLEGPGIPDGMPELLANAHVVLLGYHVIPDQTAPGQARMQFEERANDRLAEFQTILESAGATVEPELVFTHEKQQTIDRQIREHDCLAVLVPQSTKPPETVLVALRGTVGSSRVSRLVAGLFAGTDVDITLYHLAEAGETDEDAETMLDAVRGRLVELGVDENAVALEVDRNDGSREAIVEASAGYDAVVMGESAPSLTTFVFGMAADDVAEQFLGPVLVVQRERSEPDD
jgi:nucleotide-binding universal stress UspA family protein